jgi:hypothetical protein
MLSHMPLGQRGPKPPSLASASSLADMRLFSEVWLPPKRLLLLPPPPKRLPKMDEDGESGTTCVVSEP